MVDKISINKYILKTNSCWLWTGGCRDNGYPVCRWNNKTKGTSRIIYELHYGKFNKSLFVCHKCDNPKCVNPEHLFLGTPQDNVNDMFKKGRQKLPVKTMGSFTKGDCHPLRKIKVKDCKKIKELYKKLKSLRKVAAIYNVSYSTIKNVINNTTFCG
jgi:hypothetical protein